MLITRDRDFYRTMMIVALPAALQSFLSLLVVMVDNIMVGSLSDLAFSAVSMSNSVTALFTALMFGLASGSSALISQYWGKKDMGSIKEVFAVVFKICGSSAIIISALVFFFPGRTLRIVTDDSVIIAEAIIYLRIVSLSYLLFGISSSMVMMLRFVETVKITLYISIGSLIANISLNYILIFGHLGFPAMGIKGAAIATLLTRIIELIIVYLYTFKVQKRIDLKISDLFRKTSMIKDYVLHGLPIAIGDTQWALIGLFKASIVGHLGALMITANSVAGNIMPLGMLFTGAMAGGACVVIGKSVGSGNYDKTREYSRTIQILFAGLGIFSSMVIFLTRHLTTALFTGLSAEAISLASTFIGIGALTMIGTTYHASCFIGINRGSGDGRFVVMIDMICGWLIVLPLSYLAAFVFKWPLPVVFLMLYIDQCFKWLIAFLRLRGNKWIRNVTRNNALPSESPGCLTGNLLEFPVKE